MKTTLPLVVLTGALLSAPAMAKMVTLKVSNSDNLQLKNALIKVRATDIQATTNDLGLVQLDLPAGSHTIDVEASNQLHFHYQIEIMDGVNYGSNNPIEISIIAEPEHKLVINANPLEHTALDMATPIILIAGDELTSKKSGTLGDILKLEPGMSVSSFGPAVSRPVIRGLSGSRVKITNNQMSVLDASTNSADHDVGIEPLLAEQIEVVKGPATLLYGSGAIGGVVNVTDRKINPGVVDELTGGVELRLGDSVTGEQSAVVTLDGGTGNWNWHIDGYSNQSDDIEIPGFAESEILREHEEAEHHEEAEEHHEEEASGLLENSSNDTKGFNIGSTFLLSDAGYIGFSVGKIDKNYGVPGHAEHHEEEEVPHEEGEEEEHHEEGVAIDMEQTRYDLQTSFDKPFDGFENFFAGLSYTDYQHQEIEGDEVGTKFVNKASEFRSYLKHEEWNGWMGVYGIQLTNRDFSSIGEEAIVPASDTQTAAFYWLEEKHFGDLKWELGARYEKQTIEINGRADTKDSSVSYSSGAVYSLAKHNKLAVNVSHAVRFASVEERFVFGPHLATRSFEIGNENLEQESSNNFDFSYRFENDHIKGEFNLFWNEFSDFIFAENVALTDSCLTPDAISTAEEDDLLLVCYKQRDATYKGAELQVEVPLFNINGHYLQLDTFADRVTAELKDGSNLPRIPASKLGLQLAYSYQDWSADLTWVHHSSQTKLGLNELKTSAFEQVDMEVGYRIPSEDNELFLFFKGRNLLDEEARDHSSFIKDLAPRAARNFSLGMRYSF